jgi:hypothetical protein
MLDITYNNMIPQHKITFLNYDGTEVYSYYVDHGQVVSDPSSQIADKLIKPADEQYTYTFENWTPAIDTSVAVTSPQTYTAVYSPVKRSYTVT